MHELPNSGYFMVNHCVGQCAKWLLSHLRKCIGKNLCRLNWWEDYLASKCNVPVVPVAHNAGRIGPRGSSVKGPGTVRVVIGKPIMPGLRATELNASIESWIRMQNL